MERKILVMRHRGAKKGVLISEKGLEHVEVPIGQKPKVSTITYSKPMYWALSRRAVRGEEKPQPAPEIPRAQAEALIRTKRRGYNYIALVKPDGIEMHRKTISTGFCEGTPISAIPDTGKKNFVNLVHSHLFNLGYPKPYPMDLDELCVHVWELNEARGKTLTAHDVLQAPVEVGFRYHFVNGEILNTLTIVDSGFTVTTEVGSLPVGTLCMEPEEFTKLQNALMKGVPPGSHKTWTDRFDVDDSEENPIKRWLRGLTNPELFARMEAPRPQAHREVYKTGPEIKWPFSPLTDEEKARLNEMVKPAHVDASGSPYRTPEYYDNSKGSLYKVASDRGWNPYLFDIVKRLERGGKKDPLEKEIDKTIALLELWKDEILGNNR